MTSAKVVTRCCRCSAKASCASGHVHRGDEKIIAGFCRRHRLAEAVNRWRGMKCCGCYGRWLKRMGVQPWDAW